MTDTQPDDEEDLQLATSPEFWRMIEERRCGPSIPLAELEARLKKARPVKPAKHKNARRTKPIKRRDSDR